LAIRSSFHRRLGLTLHSRFAQVPGGDFAVAADARVEPLGRNNDEVRGGGAVREAWSTGVDDDVG
jgi:hypothetical protein